MSISTQTSETKFLFGQDNDVLVSLNNRRMVITLNKTKTLNALTISMIKTIYMALKDVRDNHSADIVILKSSIDKAFCAGGDVLGRLFSIT
jgi:enoyl-CoA hydratase/carnithine racemase